MCEVRAYDHGWFAWNSYTLLHEKTFLNLKKTLSLEILFSEFYLNFSNMKKFNWNFLCEKKGDRVEGENCGKGVFEGENRVSLKRSLKLRGDAQRALTVPFFSKYLILLLQFLLISTSFPFLAPNILFHAPFMKLYYIVYTEYIII